jgi:hypothetical protein
MNKPVKQFAGVADEITFTGKPGYWVLRTGADVYLYRQDALQAEGLFHQTLAGKLACNSKLDCFWGLSRWNGLSGAQHAYHTSFATALRNKYSITEDQVRIRRVEWDAERQKALIAVSPSPAFLNQPGSPGNAVFLLDGGSGQIDRLTHNPLWPADTMALHNGFAAVVQDGLYVFEGATPLLPEPITLPTALLATGIFFLENHRCLLAVDGSGLAMMMAMDTANCLLQFQIPDYEYRQPLSCSPGGLLATGNHFATLHIMQLGAGKILHHENLSAGGIISAVAINDAEQAIKMAVNDTDAEGVYMIGIAWEEGP